MALVIATNSPVPNSVKLTKAIRTLPGSVAVGAVYNEAIIASLGAVPDTTTAGPIVDEFALERDTPGASPTVISTALIFSPAGSSPTTEHFSTNVVGIDPCSLRQDEKMSSVGNMSNAIAIFFNLSSFAIHLDPLKRDHVLAGPARAPELVLRVIVIRISERDPDDDGKRIRDIQFPPDEIGVGGQCHGDG